MTKLLIELGTDDPKSRDATNVARIEGIGWFVVVVYGSMGSRIQPETMNTPFGCLEMVGTGKLGIDVSTYRRRLADGFVDKDIFS